jgi:Spy/CpxP family protein refolding chaperone
MKKVLIPVGIAALLAAVGFLVAPAFGQGRHMMGPGGRGMVSDWQQSGVKLTAAQRKQLSDLQLKHLNETAEFRLALQTRALELDSLWSADDPNAATILAKMKEMNTIRDQLQRKMVDLRLAVRKIVGNDLCGMGRGCGMTRFGMMGQGMMMGSGIMGCSGNCSTGDMPNDGGCGRGGCGGPCH